MFIPFPRSHCMCPSSTAASVGRLLTRLWHAVRPTMQDCAVLERTRVADAGPLHQPHHHWLDSGLESGCAHQRMLRPGPYAFNTGADVQHRPTISRPVPCVRRAASSIRRRHPGPCYADANVIYSDAHLQRFLLVMNCRAKQDKEKLATNI